MCRSQGRLRARSAVELVGLAAGADLMRYFDPLGRGSATAQLRRLHSLMLLGFRQVFALVDDGGSNGGRKNRLLAFLLLPTILHQTVLLHHQVMLELLVFFFATRRKRRLLLHRQVFDGRQAALDLRSLRGLLKR